MESIGYRMPRVLDRVPAYRPSAGTDDASKDPMKEDKPPMEDKKEDKKEEKNYDP